MAVAAPSAGAAISTSRVRKASPGVRPSSENAAMHPTQQSTTHAYAPQRMMRLRLRRSAFVSFRFFDALTPIAASITHTRCPHYNIYVAILHQFCVNYDIETQNSHI